MRVLGAAPIPSGGRRGRRVRRSAPRGRPGRQTAPGLGGGDPLAARRRAARRSSAWRDQRRIRRVVVVSAHTTCGSTARRTRGPTSSPADGAVAAARGPVPPASLDDDAEAQEEHKIKSFIGMVAGVGAFGVPLATVAAGPASAVETWPLAQAFALQQFETLTGGGFFTQRHKVLPSLAELRALVVSPTAAPSPIWSRSRRRASPAAADVEAALDRAPAPAPSASRRRRSASPPSRTTSTDPRRPPARRRRGRGQRSPRAPPRVAHRARADGGAELGGGAGRRRRPGGRAPPAPRGRRAGGPLYAGRTLFLGSGISAPPRAPPSKPEPARTGGGGRDARAMRVSPRARVAAAKARPPTSRTIAPPTWPP